MRISDWSSDVCSSDLANVDSTRIYRLYLGIDHGLVGIQRTADADDPCRRSADRRRLPYRRRAKKSACAAHGNNCVLNIQRRGCLFRHHQPTAQPPLTRSPRPAHGRSEEHTSELQSLMRSSYAVFCLKQKTTLSSDTTYTQLI